MDQWGLKNWALVALELQSAQKSGRAYFGVAVWGVAFRVVHSDIVDRAVEYRLGLEDLVLKLSVPEKVVPG